MQGDRSCLIHMIECIRAMEKYAEDGRSAFMGSTLVQDAVLWNLQLMSACALRLSDMEKRMHPEVDWQRVGRLFRDLVRDPWSLEVEKVWQCVETDVRALKTNLEAILRPRTGRL